MKSTIVEVKNIVSSGKLEDTLKVAKEKNLIPKKLENRNIFVTIGKTMITSREKYYNKSALILEGKDNSKGIIFEADNFYKLYRLDIL